jgi:hypothetical protein
MAIKAILQKMHWFLASQVGVDPRRFLNSLCGLPSFISGWIAFSANYSGKMEVMPCLYDKHEEGGSIKNEYFWQDLYVARAIFLNNPKRHIDIGSRVDGFVAHVASFREIEVFDVRPITTQITGIRFTQADLMNLAIDPIEGEVKACDSISCLHALEHFGLGRYGDPIDPNGYALGFANMAKILIPGGRFYLSTPIGRERVIFNANWVFDPRTILSLAKDNGMQLECLAIIDPTRGPNEIKLDDASLEAISKNEYQLGVFKFIKMPIL